MCETDFRPRPNSNFDNKKKRRKVIVVLLNMLTVSSEIQFFDIWRAPGSGPGPWAKYPPGLGGFGRFWGENLPTSVKNRQNRNLFARNRRFCREKTAGGRLPGDPHKWSSRPTFGPADLARLPGLLCLGSAELVLPCSLPCFALPRPPASLIREAALRAAPPLWIPL